MFKPMKITASMLYDYIQCPHRVWRDAYGPQDEKIKETNPFVQLLWERGIEAWEKSLKLNPGNLQLAQQLKKVKGY